MKLLLSWLSGAEAIFAIVYYQDENYNRVGYNLMLSIISLLMVILLSYKKEKN